MIAPLDSRLCILNPINHFSTHLRPAKGKPLWLYLFLALLYPSPSLDHHVLHIMCISTMIIISCSCTISLWSCGHHSWPPIPSSHVLLIPNSKHLTHGISNLVSLITKTKLGLSISPFLVIDDNHHKDMKWKQFLILIVLAPPIYVLPWVCFNCAHMYGFEFWESYYYQIDAKVHRMDLSSVIPIGVAFIYHP
jgi:hypothetical protein